MSTGQWLLSPDGARWWFDSGATCLDFVYTGARSSDVAVERLHRPGDLGQWLGERFERVDREATDRDLADGLMLREAIAAALTALSRSEEIGATDIDTINLFAATPDIPPALVGGSRQAGRSSVRAGQALSALAREAVMLFSDRGHGRIRGCAAEDCSLVFYDESRSNNRRWCSMQRCGNRSKVRAYRMRATR